MSLETLEKVYDALTSEPQTPNEIANKIDLNQKTVQGALLELVNTKKNVRWKKIGRYRLFWKVK
jgi:predicted transcriptional regulator